MKLRIPLDVWRLTFFSSLGVAVTASCSGQVTPGAQGGSLETGASGGDAPTGSQSANGSGPTTSTGSSASGSGSGGSDVSNQTGTVTDPELPDGEGGSDDGSGGEDSNGGTGTVTGTASGSTGGSGASLGGATATGSSEGGVGASSAGGSEPIGGTTGSGGEPSGGGGKNACTDAEDVGGGFESCSRGFFHRSETTACTANVRTTECTFADSPEPECTVDTDCDAQPNGHCEGGIQIAGCFCDYGCLEDADCGAGQVCFCGDPVGRCVTASCTTDADCEGDALCASESDIIGFGPGGFSCQTPEDECAGDADCTEVGGGCRSDGAKRTCQPLAVVGRPFLVYGTERVASVCDRNDWTTSIDELATGQLTSAERSALAEHFERIGQMEHASIAAFARFSLQLLALGAPAELVDAATAAMADETRHAKIAFAVASVYRGHSVGPSRLGLDGALAESSLRDVTLNTVLEGCIGETVAAVEAREVAAHVTDPALRRVFEQIADDEARHAHLAWQFLKWAVRQGGSRLADEALRLMESVREDESARPTLEDDHWLALGLVTDRVRGEIRRQVLRDVVMPCARKLLVNAQGETAVSARA